VSSRAAAALAVVEGIWVGREAGGFPGGRGRRRGRGSLEASGEAEDGGVEDEERGRPEAGGGGGPRWQSTGLL
jgi:hypothetical protein